MTNLENRVLVRETNIQNMSESLSEVRNDLRLTNSRIDDLNRKVDSNLKWLLGVILATWITTIGAVIGSAVAL